ncbi:MAG: VWA domain-containing protein [Candidatus Melainabacteria bacterium]|nr:MAG: VWA domain-containing protein [Candidatus Melainabacteria bacterium]
MHSPKLLLLILGLGTCSTYLISSSINSEVNMFHAFDHFEKKVDTAASASVPVIGSYDPSASIPRVDPSTSIPSVGADAFSSSDTTESADTPSSSDTTERASDSRTSDAAVIASGSSPLKPTAEDSTYSKLIAPSIKSKNGERPSLDLAFCIDTTSSMQGEIDTVKAKVKSMVARIAHSKSRPVVRVGLVAYRDFGDEYVTRFLDFSNDIDEVENSISNLMADGGGDGPEAVDRGLRVAINDLDWREDKRTAKLLFLIGDAPTHNDSEDDLQEQAKFAAAKGIHINTIACDGLEGYGDHGIPLYKKVAQLTNGNFEPLAYNQQIVDTHGHAATLITSGGKSYVVKSTDKEAWKGDINTLVAKGIAAPALQGATNGTIGVQGSDATYITGVNTAGTVRASNNLDSVMVNGAESLMSKMGF